MRDFIVCITILISVFTASYFSEKYLIESGNNLIERLTVIKDEIEEDSMENIEELKAIKKEWDKIERNWNMLSNHISTDNIELAFTRLLISYGEDEKSECLVNIAEVIALIQDTPRSEKIDWENIL